MAAGAGGGPLTIILPLLTSSSVSLDLAAHSDTLQFAGNLVSGIKPIFYSVAFEFHLCLSFFGISIFLSLSLLLSVLLPVYLSVVSLSLSYDGMYFFIHCRS